MPSVFLRTALATLLSCALFGNGMSLFGQEKPAAGTAQNPDAAPAQPPAAAAKPAPVPVTDPYDPIDGNFSVGIYGFLTNKRPVIRNGKDGSTTNPSNLDFPGKNFVVPGLVVTFPAGKGNNLKFSYMRGWASGTTPKLTTARGFYGTDYDIGDALATKFTLQNFKLSWDFLSWPNPSQGSFRFKTLWEVQYVNVKTTLNVPGKVDTSGALVDANAQGTNWMVAPTFGVGIEKFFGPHFRFEARGSGFILPSHRSIVDAEALFAYRVGKLEISVGGKEFQFRTSNAKSEAVRANMPGVMLMVRWWGR